MALCALSADNRQVMECHSITGSESFRHGDYAAAYQALRDCDLDKGASARSLAQLGFLISEKGFGHFPTSTARAKLAFKLIREASIKGDADAKETLSSLYRTGEPLLGLAPSEEISDCLDEVSEDSLSNAVESCLAGRSGEPF
jgi:hypothetical protein